MMSYIPYSIQVVSVGLVTRTCVRRMVQRTIRKVQVWLEWWDCCRHRHRFALSPIGCSPSFLPTVIIIYVCDQSILEGKWVRVSSKYCTGSVAGSNNCWFVFFLRSVGLDWIGLVDIYTWINEWLVFYF